MMLKKKKVEAKGFRVRPINEANENSISENNVLNQQERFRLNGLG